MNSSDALFLERCRLDLRRQPSRDTSLKELIATWKALFPTLGHPYAMQAKEKGQLAKSSVHFGGGSLGAQTTPAVKYLYALTSVRKLDYLATWHSSETDEAIHDKLVDLAGKPRRWIPLASHVAGPLKSFRMFTWWTTMDVVATGQPFIAGRRLGLVDSWIANLAVILRWEIDPAAASLHLPTCCDAFDGPVFESMPESGSSGRTIDLNCNPFEAGEPEFAVTALPVDQISVYPIRVGPDFRRHVPPLAEDDGTWTRLAEYYRDAK